MMQENFIPDEIGTTGFHHGDLLIIPKNNVKLRAPKGQAGFFKVKQTVDQAGNWLSDMHLSMGVNFYFNQKSCLPFGFGSVPNEHYDWYMAGFFSFPGNAREYLAETLKK